MVLNELVIDRGTAPSLTNLHVYADGAFVTVVQGDGLIVATPTGSTAYNLAAGGSMVHPGVPCLLFTPICPHTLSSRPLVFPEHVALTIVVPREARAGVYASFDGKHRVLLAPGDGVAVRASQFPVPTVCNLDASNDWFRSVRDGLNWNARVVQGAGEKAAKA
uniref:NAD(+) kinase n=2 Tax=Auxenochlorella protothecoides TaxID=3075 RepID=A0A1D2A8F8_AUXPR